MATLVSVKKAEQSPGVPVEIEVPASTAWPLVLAFGFSLMSQVFLRVRRSVSWASCLLWPVASAGSEKCFLTSTKKPCRSCSKIIA